MDGSAAMGLRIACGATKAIVGLTTGIGVGGTRR